MIYLFDDTDQKYIDKHIDFNEYSDVITFVHRAKSSDIDVYEHALKKADCILIHRSFRDLDDVNKNTVYEKVINDISNLGYSIPLVIYSDGDREVADFKNDRFLRQIKKLKVYERLKLFLDEYRRSKTIDLRILGYGETNVLQTVIESANIILSKIRFNRPEEVLRPEMLAEIRLKDLIERSQPSLGISYLELLFKIENGEVMIGKFRENINSIVKSFNNYGKNLYTWQ